MRRALAMLTTFVVMVFLFVPSLASAQTAPSELEVRVTDTAGKTASNDFDITVP